MHQALLAAIRASPDDDAPRSVFADLLLSAGDPRGDFIALQLGPASEASARRATTLLRKHLDAWLGELVPFVVKASVTFTRGFPDTARVSIRRDEDLPSARSLDAWFSFTALEFKERSFFTDAMRSLKKVSGVDARGLADLHATPPPLRRLSATVDRHALDGVLPRALERLPHLEALRLSTGRIDDASIGALLRRLPGCLHTLTLEEVSVTPARGFALLGSAPLHLERAVLGAATFTRTTTGWTGQGPAFS